MKETAIIAGYLTAIAVVVAIPFIFYGSIIYVAAHFIAKFW